MSAPDDQTPDDRPGPRREYRIEELARAAGVKVRNLRYYQERGLLPPPRREGRIAWYSQAHLARLRVITELLERGHTLTGIGELLSAWEQGSGVGELLGLERAMTEAWSHEEPVTLPTQEMLAMFGGRATEADIARAAALGHLTVEGGRATHFSRRLLEGSAALVREGVPLEAVLETAERLRAHVDAMADLFVGLVRHHVLGELPLSAERAHALAGAVERLRPVAGDVACAEFSRSMERRVRAEVGGLLSASGRRTGDQAPANG
ncbi:MerR family transcriptional regulator [Wenjunlia tyrosinilytica]|uniref:MerR family transcriptional regulator n=1 Tax=Wenjunlia tyrosinilytica TaxID=1544741 RepID=A0A917ZQP7_9ACTN|nr:MerR family transcriptional regulator [Wenjunlia tyrosinilytica]GGO89152.1 MerR family transcriptional regulator [Wenjunlia tyrosinilytica]